MNTSCYVRKYEPKLLPHNWKADPGTFEIQIGNSSRNLTGKAEFELK